MLSIIYLTRNRSNELKKSIQSCEEHVSMVHEYIVVDNGSTDDTADVINNLRSAGLTILYMLQDSNKGVAGGRNIGFSAASGDICYFIDDDATIMSEGYVLDTAYDYMQKRPEIYAMGTDCYDTERCCQLIGCLEKGANTHSVSKIRGYIGCSHFVRKNAIKNDYLYPNNLMYGSEELYAGLSIYGNGGIVVLYPYLKVLHKPSVSTRDSRESRKRNGHINTYVIKRYFLKSPFKQISFLMFLLRILRFEHFSINKVVEDFRIVSERFDPQYSNPISNKLVKNLCTTFGLECIL